MCMMKYVRTTDSAYLLFRARACNKNWTYMCQVHIEFQIPIGATKKSIPNGDQLIPPSFTGASNELTMAFFPKANSATNTGRHTIKTIKIYKITKAAPPP